MQKPDLDHITKEHLQLLHKVLIQEVGEKIKDFEDYVLNGVITFESLWMIFQPGTFVISKHNGDVSVSELIEASYGESLQSSHAYSLDLSIVDWDGTAFGRNEDWTSVTKFTGTRKITSLSAFPFQFHEKKEEIENLLIARGKKFEELAGNHYKG
jgi:hypothetical protein